MTRIIILTEGRTEPNVAKTAAGVVRYRTKDVVALLDTTQAGRTAQELLGAGGDIPIVARLSEVDADTLLIGISPVGGDLPEAWRPVIREAIERGMKVISGLHVFVGEDPEFSALAKEKGVEIVDARRTPDDLTVSENIARNASCFRVHTVGNDCNVGKMHTAIELAAGLEKQGHRTKFVATGQTGIMITGWGIAVDRAISDFVAGATERLVMENQDEEFLVIEGQGSLIHPFYSGVTLGLLHGCAPQAMVMCYQARTEKMRHLDWKIRPLDEVIEHYERMAGLICPSRVIALSVNTSKLSPDEADYDLKAAEDRFGIPTTDPVRCGPEKLVEATLKAAAT